MDPDANDSPNDSPNAGMGNLWEDPKCFESAYGGSTAVMPRLLKPKVEIKVLADNGEQAEGARDRLESPFRLTIESEGPTNPIEPGAAVVRLAPDAQPEPMMPSQIVFHQRPSRKRKNPALRMEDMEWGKPRKRSVRWILWMSLGVASLVIMGLLILPLINESYSPDRKSGALEVEVDPDEVSESIAHFNNIMPLQVEAERIYQLFTNANTPEELLPLVRNAAAVEPLIRANPLPAGGTKGWQPDRNTLWSIHDTDGLTCGILEGVTQDFSKLRAYFVLENHHLSLDWKATTGYGTATFDELARHEGNPAEIRGIIHSADFYTIAYPEEEFQSYLFLSPDSTKSIWCYSRRDDAVNRKLNLFFKGGEILEASQEPQQVTLRLKPGPADSLPNQWLIEKLLQENWITQPLQSE